MYYFLKQTWSNIRTSWSLVLQAVLMMVIAFFIVSAFAILSLQVESVLLRWESEAPILAYLKDNLPEKRKQELVQEIKTWPTIREVRIVSPSQSIARLRQTMGKQRHLLADLDSSLLPTSLEINIILQARTDTHIKKLEQTLLQLSGILSVDIGQTWFAPLWTLVRWVRGILWGGGSLLLICACLMAAGTIRMALFVHHHEIEIMRLLGATEHFIRIPFYLEGGLKGFLASLCSIGLLFLLYSIVHSQYNAAFLSFTTIPLQFFSWLHISLLLLIGTITGLFGSWIALQSTQTEQTESSAP